MATTSTSLAGPLREGAKLAQNAGGTGAPAKLTPEELGDNNENLETLRPELTAALRELVLGYRTEGIVARRSEIRRIRQARLFWQGIQDAWWDPKAMQWNPTQGGSVALGAAETGDGPRFQYVTNLFQAFGLSFISVITQDVPATEFYPQSAQSLQDIATAKAASDVAELILENNDPQKLLAWIGFYLWTDGKIGGYVRYVADGQRFGFKDEPQYETGDVDMDGQKVPQLRVTTSKKVPNGEEVISIVDGLQLNTPVWAREQFEFPYLQWQMEVHIAKLKASYPKAADKILLGGAINADDVYARSTRVAVSQGMAAVYPGDALQNLITYSRTWIRPWAFYQLENKKTRDELLELFPDGCYVAIAGETYCESRNEGMDSCWRVMHALPGDGQNRPAVGTSLVEVQERYNTLSNIQMETAEYGIPPTYADPQVLDFEALANQTAEPAATYPARPRPGQPLENSFYSPQASQMAPDAIAHMGELFGPIAQFITGLMPSIFGGGIDGGKTAAEYAMARDQALGRIGLVWRGVKQFWCEISEIGVECFRRSRSEDVEIPQLGDDGQFESQWIRMADLQGNIQAHPESDEGFPRLKSQQRAALQQVVGMAGDNPEVLKALGEPANLGYIKSLMGLTELVIPGEDSRNKQLREIQQLLQGAPVQMPPQAPGQPPQSHSTVPVDQMLDRHDVEFEECKRWASSEAGMVARQQNPNGFANVHAHAGEHQAALKALQNPPEEKPPAESINFKDLPPDGQLQLAAQAGIKLNPLALMAAKAHEQAGKAAELHAKLNPPAGPAGPAAVPAK